MKASQSYFLTKEGREAILQVLSERRMSCRELATQLGMIPGTLSSRLHAHICTPTIVAEKIYDLLESPADLLFLTQYATRQPVELYVPHFFTRENITVETKRRELESLERKLAEKLAETGSAHTTYENILQPYFTEIDLAFKGADRLGKLEMLNGLDQLITKYAGEVA